MTSSAAMACNGSGQTLQRPPESEASVISSFQKWPSSRRSSTTTSCHSSSPSLSSTSSSDNDSPDPPFTGIPFSWEQLPGIPKKQILNKSNNSSIKIFDSLPLPPIPSDKFSYKGVKKKCAATSAAAGDGFRLDPFLAALVECSKDEGSVWRSGKSSSSSSSSSRRRSGNSNSDNAISDRFALLANLNGYSCKRTCAVSESIVYLPRSGRHGYHVIDKSAGYKV